MTTNVNIEYLKEIERKISHYKYLDKHLNDFFIAVLGESLDQLGMGGIVSAHGDKGRGAAMRTRKAGIPFPHMMMLFMLTYTDYCKADWREIRMEDWIVEEYKKHKDKLPEINLDDTELQRF